MNNLFTKKSVFIALSLLIIIVVLFMLGIPPIDGQITQGRPTIEMLCNMQIACSSSEGKFKCSEEVSSEDYRLLKKWENFHGCNNKTPGYIEENNRILVKYCHCGGLM